MAKTDEKQQVIPMTTGAAETTLEMDGKRYPWGRSGGFQLNDPGEAAALKAKYGHMIDTYSAPVPHPADRGHRYTFSVPELPWKREKKEESNGT